MTSFVGPYEVAQMLNVSRQRVVQIAATADFPRPVAVLKMGNVWSVKDIREWAERKGRTLIE